MRLERANDHLLGEAKQRLQLERSGSVHEIYMRRYVQLAQEPAASPDSEGLHRRLAVRQDGAQLDEANAQRKDGEDEVKPDTSKLPPPPATY